MPRPSRSVSPQLRAALVWGAAATVILAVLGAGVGWLLGGPAGAASALLGVVPAGLFLGITAASLLIALRVFGRPEQIGAFYGVVLGGWLLKLVLFMVVVLSLREQPWVVPRIFLVAVIVSVLASLIIDMLAIAKVRVPYVGDIALPQAPASTTGGVSPGVAADRVDLSPNTEARDDTDASRLSTDDAHDQSSR